MPLDTTTLLTVATCVTGLLGVVILVVWVQERGTRALAWWGAAYLIGGSAVGLWSVQSGASPLAQAAPNMLLFIAGGMIWNGARIFQGRPVLVGGLFAGATLWTIAMQFSAFAQSEHLRVVLSSLVIAAYTFLTAFELQHERRKPVAKSWFAPFMPVMHSIVFLSPIPLTLLTPPGTSSDGWLALFALETLLYVVGTAFIVVIMAKERVALSHKNAAMTDPLTGLFNRRAFHEIGQELMTRQAKSRSPISLLLYDLDHFKSINDRFGHLVGDDVLRVFAITARNNLRATDVLSRLGGEEFAVLLPGGPAEAKMVGERLRVAFEAAAVEIGAHRMEATVSAGAASALAPVDVFQLMGAADRALYEAKLSGRNCVVMAPSDALPPPVPMPEAPRAGAGPAARRWVLRHTHGR